jgi:hypothetical protein
MSILGEVNFGVTCHLCPEAFGGGEGVVVVDQPDILALPSDAKVAVSSDREFLAKLQDISLENAQRGARRAVAVWP